MFGRLVRLRDTVIRSEVTEPQIGRVTAKSVWLELSTTA
jgi:hypothetical protein